MMWLDREALQWRHMSVMACHLNHRQLHSFFNTFRLATMKSSNICITVFYEGNPPLVSGFPSQRSCNVDSVSMSWRHDVIGHICMHENVFMVRRQRLGQPRVNHFFVFLKYHPTCFNIEPDEITINFVHPGICIAKHHALCSWRS